MIHPRTDPPAPGHERRERRGALRRGRRTTAVTAAALAAATLGCGGAAGERRGSSAVVDDAGDTVAVAVPARRVVSLVPAATELLFAVGAGPQVVGRTAWCDWPAAVHRVPSLGDGIAPALEPVLARRPDLVVLYNSARNGDAARRLRALAVPALRLATNGFADAARHARLLGRLTGHAEAADSFAEAFAADLRAATPPPGGRRPRVLVLVWDRPPMTVGRGSFLHELLERAGAENLFGDVAGSSAVVGIETVAARDPDVVLTLTEGAAGFAARPEWRAVRAVREGRLVRVTGSEFSRPGPRAPAAIRRLAALLRGAAP